MFSKPNAGWVTIEKEGFRGYASFIQPFVFDTLTAITEHLINGSSQCVNYDEEGSDFTIVFTNQMQIYIIIHRQYLHIISLKITPLEFAKEIINDFETHKEDWNNFVCEEHRCDDTDEKEYCIDQFNEYLGYLKYIINLKEEDVK